MPHPDLTPPAQSQPIVMGMDQFRVSFADTLAHPGITEDLAMVCYGAGQTVSQSASNLVITTGTTVNEEVIIRSKQSWRATWAFRFRLQLSQRIANQSFILELADIVQEDTPFVVNSATSVTFTLAQPAIGRPRFDARSVGMTMTIGNIRGLAGAVPGDAVIAAVDTIANTVTLTVSGWPASGSGTALLYGMNCYRNIYSGTTATNCTWEPRRRGYQLAPTTLTCTTTATPGLIADMRTDGFNATLGDTSATLGNTTIFSTRALRLENLPDQDIELFMFIRAANGSTAPASTTTMTVGFVGIDDRARVEVFGFQTTPLQIQSPAAAGLTAQVQGNTTAGSTSPTNPVMMGMQAQTAELASADANNSARYPMSSPGRQLVVRPNQIRAAQNQNTITLSSTTETTLLTAVTARFLDITTLIVANTNATTPVRVDFRSTTGGAVVFSVWVNANTTVHITDPTGILQAAVNTNWTATLSAAVTDVRIYAKADRSVG